LSFNFFFSNNKLLPSKQLFDYLRKLKNLIFLNNICLTSILHNYIDSAMKGDIIGDISIK